MGVLMNILVALAPTSTMRFCTCGRACMLPSCLSWSSVSMNRMLGGRVVLLGAAATAEATAKHAKNKLLVCMLGLGFRLATSLSQRPRAR